MVVISEIPGGSNGGDPNNNPNADQNKNPQEGEQNEVPREEEKNQNENPQQVEENQNENPQEEEENQSENPQEEEENQNENSQQVEENQNENPQQEEENQNVITSQSLFETLSRLGITEPVLYALIVFPLVPPSWFFLRRSNTPLHLRRISSLPPMFPGSATVTIGHKMYVMGGYIGFYQPLKLSIVIHCELNRWDYLPNMQRARYHAAAGVIDGKIYVIGGRKKRDNDWVEVFDIEQESWETVPGQCPNDASESGEFDTHVVMQEKIFILDRLCCLAYEPRQGIWQSWGVASQLRRFWHPSSCVVEDLLYTIDRTCSDGHPILVYYPNELVWRPVMGVYTFHLPGLIYKWSKMANFGGKLVILGSFYRWPNDIGYVEIALETRQGGEIWGNVESISRVYGDMSLPSIVLCRTVTV